MSPIPTRKSVHVQPPAQEIARIQAEQNARLASAAAAGAPGAGGVADGPEAGGGTTAADRAGVVVVPAASGNPAGGDHGGTAPGGGGDGGAQRPAWLPERYKAEADYHKAFAEQERSLARQAQELAQLRAAVQAADAAKLNAQIPGTGSPGAEPGMGGAAGGNSNAPASAPLLSREEIEKYVTKWTEKGELDAEDYAALAAKNVSREFAEDHFRGLDARRSIADKARDEIFGGSEKYNEAATWANEHLPEVELRAISELVSSMDPQKAASGASILRARFEGSEGIRATLELQGRSSSHSQDVFQTKEEVGAYIQANKELYFGRGLAAEEFQRNFKLKYERSISTLK
jgi:hypothetical protein